MPDLFWMTAILWIGFTVRIAQLGKPSLWLDEAITWLIVSAPLKEGLERMLVDAVHPPLHYLILRPVAAMNQNEFALRLPSVLFGLVSIPLMYRLGRAVAGAPGRERLVGLLAAAFLAINPFHVWFAREARNYELVFLLSLLILYSFHHIIQNGKGWIGFVVASTLAYFTHYLTLLLALVQLIYFSLTFRESHRYLRRWVLAQSLAILPLMLWLTALFSQETVGAGIGWIPQPSLLAPLLTLWNFAILYVENELWWGVVGLPFFACALVLGLKARPQRTLLALWLFFPCLSILFLSKAMGHSFYVDRYFIFSLPAFVVLLARGLDQIRRQWIHIGLTAGLLFISTVATMRLYSAPELAKQDWREAMRIIAMDEQPGDLKVVEFTLGAVPAVYYLSTPESKHRPPPYPEGSYWLAVLNSSGFAPWTDLQPRPGEDPLLTIQDLYAPQRLWLIYLAPASNHQVSSGVPFDIFSHTDPATVALLRTHRSQMLAQYTLPGISLVLMEASP